MGFLAWTRRDWFLIVVSVVAPVAAVFFLLPARLVGPAELEDPPLGRFVEVTVDRVQPLPWTFHNDHRTITARFALGWIGERAVLMQTDPEIPPGPTFQGELHRLSGEPRRWVAQAPGLEAVVYDAVLDISKPQQRTLVAVMAIVFSLGALGVWLWRLRQWSAPAHAAVAPGLIAPPLDVLPPRTDEIVAAAVRKHAPLYYFAVYFVLYAMLVMALPGVIIAAKLEPHFWDTSSTSRQIEMFALGMVLASPVSIWPFLWWVRRRRVELERVVRDGVVTGGVVTSATAWNRANSYTIVEISAAIDGVSRRYRGLVRRVPGWARPETPVRVLANRDDRYAIVIAPTGDDFAARRR